MAVHPIKKAQALPGVISAVAVVQQRHTHCTAVQLPTCSVQALLVVKQTVALNTFASHVTCTFTGSAKVFLPALSRSHLCYGNRYRILTQPGLL
jgi:hypothetical protein